MAAHRTECFGRYRLCGDHEASRVERQAFNMQTQGSVGRKGFEIGMSCILGRYPAINASVCRVGPVITDCADEPRSGTDLTTVQHVTVRDGGQAVVAGTLKRGEGE